MEMRSHQHRTRGKRRGRIPTMLRHPCFRALLLHFALLPGASAAAVLELRIPAGGSDAEEASGGSVVLTGNDLELVEDGASQTVGLRFQGVSIPRHYLITAAWLQFQADETNSAAASLVFQAENAANAAPFTTTSRSVSSRPRTAESMTWSPPPWTRIGDAGPAQRTPDLSSVIQPIISGESWASGNALALIVT